MRNCNQAGTHIRRVGAIARNSSREDWTETGKAQGEELAEKEPTVLVIPFTVNGMTK
jgi:hypothetical protein